METRQLQHFLVVARARTLTEAAETLHITQPALSMSIRRLEEILGVSLFRRERRQMILTEAGKALLSRAEAVLNAEEALRFLPPGNSRAKRFVCGSPFAIQGPIGTSCRDSRRRFKA